MAEEKDHETISFDFPKGFDNQIAHAANSWATLEYYINSSIWALAQTEPALGACITAQIGSLPMRLNALLALLKLRGAKQGTIDRVNKFVADFREPNELRNRICHDVWLKSESDPETEMGRVEIIANKKLNFEIVTVTLNELKKDVARIARARTEFHYIRDAIFSELSTLPEIPPSKLRPISENR